MTGRSGRVRSETARVAILQATARIFGSRGYDHLTIEGVAAEAGVGKQTIYRWWHSKGELVADALLEGLLLPEPLLPPDTGDLRADLTTWLRDVFGLLQRPGGDDLVRSLAAAAAENADVGRRIRDSLGATSELAARLRTGVEAGQLPPGVAIEDFGDVLVGAVVLRALARTETDEAAAERLVSVVLGGAPQR
ncbi:TetR/AcrR family transcriptional regulator [Leifsonia sp. F6_8S_P_1B]|uniref:TetR/AcrR family transcriptional regulator n=1 Tax=Leifsonia williamsii TaxID=3035919 RepID=A0ABT8KBQ9_9MICO|nr:TetR/AcrR family transcriptional regulator [Leifsonia williamsii]MDN4613922.1 TetR/AcrR family transcriptional regulator [Leifsonia williamsii]